MKFHNYHNYRITNAVTMIDANKLDLNAITKIYVGKDDWCRCGCGGKYYVKSDKLFEKRIEEFKYLLKMGCVRKVEVGTTFVNIPIGDEKDNKCFCFYFE